MRIVARATVNGEGVQPRIPLTATLTNIQRFDPPHWAGSHFCNKAEVRG